ncbi:MAG: DUF790 family protein [Candidatus Methylarchaceae archaeon HK02M1]|nr:DUF790 family protein [Candidatus Methylarchaceae archaeon HK02M1]
MLPSNLLRARFKRGRIYPVYAPLDENTLSLTERMVEVFRKGVGRRKGELKEWLKVFEDEGFDYRLVRGLSKILERRCIFEVDTSIDPREARRTIFEEASRVKAVSKDEREKVIRKIATKLDTHPETLEKALYSDVEEELILGKFDPFEQDKLIKYYNLSLTQTLLFKSLRMEFTASGNWKNIFRAVKRLGLMYSVEYDGIGYTVSVDGPLSIFKMTDRYGTSLAKLLPQIIASESWKIRADVLGRKKSRIDIFELKSDEVKDTIEDVKSEDLLEQKLYDSTVEERFARSFNAYDSGWSMRREPEPLMAGRHVMIPDFSFEKRGEKVYLEIMGFWTQEYLEKKISKLNSITNLDMIVAVDESLACSKLKKLKGRVIYYKKYVPIKPILDHLKRVEETIIERESEELKMERIRLKGDIVSLEELAQQYSVTVESARRTLQTIDFEGYRKIGDCYISEAKLKELYEKLSSLEKLSDVLATVEVYGIKNPYQVLRAFGYTIIWDGLDFEKSKIKKAIDKSLP